MFVNALCLLMYFKHFAGEMRKSILYFVCAVSMPRLTHTLMLPILLS